jgi:acetate kinase
MRALEAAGNPEARFAIAHFTQSAIRHGHSLIGAMGGCDAIVFTGGIGENAAAIRAEIIAGFAWLGARLDTEGNAANAARLSAADSTPDLWIVPAEEERQIAADTRDLIAITAS